MFAHVHSFWVEKHLVATNTTPSVTIAQSMKIHARRLNNLTITTCLKEGMSTLQCIIFWSQVYDQAWCKMDLSQKWKLVAL